jgi:hypothetical protein
MSLCTKANAFFTSRRSKALHLAARVLKSDPYVSVGTSSVRCLYAYTFNEYEAVRAWLELNERPVTAFHLPLRPDWRPTRILLPQRLVY